MTTCIITTAPAVNQNIIIP